MVQAAAGSSKQENPITAKLHCQFHSHTGICGILLRFVFPDGDFLPASVPVDHLRTDTVKIAQDILGNDPVPVTEFQPSVNADDAVRADVLYAAEYKRIIHMPAAQKYCVHISCPSLRTCLLLPVPEFFYMIGQNLDICLNIPAEHG